MKNLIVWIQNHYEQITQIFKNNETNHFDRKTNQGVAFDKLFVV